jgi:hypothetical protein
VIVTFDSKFADQTSTASWSSSFAHSGKFLKLTSITDFLSRLPLFAGVEVLTVAAGPANVYPHCVAGAYRKSDCAEAEGVRVVKSASVIRKIRMVKDFLARMALNLSGCKNRKMATDSNPVDGHNVFDRILNERTPLTVFSTSEKGREVTLDEARSDVAKAIGAIAHTLFSKSYGPLVGTVTTTSVESILKNAEVSATRAKGDAKLVVEELSARICKEKKR